MDGRGAPTGWLERQLVIWRNGGDQPSFAFGDWHTHAGLQESDDDIIGLVKAICATGTRSAWSTLPQGQDEYDSDVGRIHRVLASRLSEREVVECLSRLERKSMRFPFSPERLRRIVEVAEKLLAIDLRRSRD